MKRLWISAGLLLGMSLTIGLLSSCGSDGGPTVGPIIAGRAESTLIVGEQQTLSITASGVGELKYEWKATRGNISDAAAPSVVYTAPSSPGADTVTVGVTDRRGSSLQSISFTIIEPTPTPTLAPTLTPTSSPTPTLTPSPTVPPTPSPTPGPPLLDIFPQVADGEAFVFINHGGELYPRYVETESCRRSNRYGLQLEYAMSGEGNGGWGVNWDKAPGGSLDRSEASTLSFWVRGQSGGETFQVGLKDTFGNEKKVESVDLLIVSGEEWRQVSLPLDRFVEAGVNVASIENVNLGFNRNHGSGTICIDDIIFE